jgi:hypothetical protein
VDGRWLSVISGDPFEVTMQLIKKLEVQSEVKGIAQMKKLYEDLAEEYTSFFEHQAG